MRFPVFDLHCDTALTLMGRSGNEAGSLRTNNGHIALDRAKNLGGYCQCFACFTTPSMEERRGVSPTVVFERELATVQREVEANRDLIRLAYSAEDIENNRMEGLMSAVLTIEGTAGFGFDPDLLDDLYQIGFRISSLGWNEKNPLTGSNVTGGGLTEEGKRYVRKAQSLGMKIDVSHISDEAFYDIMDITAGPVLATHSNSRSVCGHSRNLTDDMFRKICETGGVAGFNQYAAFVGENPDLDSACDHIFHFAEIDPDCRHIALGGDLDGCEALPKGFEGVQSYPAFARRLLERGLSEENVMDIFWNNALRVI